MMESRTRYIRIWCFAFALIFLLCLAGSSLLPAFAASLDEEAPPKTVVVDMVIATIGGEPLTISELRRYIESSGEEVPEDVHNGGFETRQHLRGLVLERLIEKEAAKSGIVVGDEEVEYYIDEIKSQNGVDEQGFREILQAQGLTLGDYRRQVKNDILRARIISSQVRRRVQIVDEDIERFLKENPDRLPEESAVHLEQILIRFDETADNGEREALRTKIFSMKKMIEGGAKLSSVGEVYYSDLGFVPIEELRLEFKKAVLKLGTNEMSEVITTTEGYYLFRLAGKFDPQGDLDPQFKEDIKKELYEVQFKEELDKFLNTELPEKYSVELKL